MLHNQTSGNFRLVFNWFHLISVFFSFFALFGLALFHCVLQFYSAPHKTQHNELFCRLVILIQYLAYNFIHLTFHDFLISQLLVDAVWCSVVWCLALKCNASKMWTMKIWMNLCGKKNKGISIQKVSSSKRFHTSFDGSCVWNLIFYKRKIGKTKL